MVLKDAVLMYFSLYLCRYGIRGEEAVGVALVELKSLPVNYEKTSFICKWLYLHCQQLGSMILNV